MKILLVAVNAKYIHSNLAVYCLKAYAEEHLRDVVSNRQEYQEDAISNCQGHQGDAIANCGERQEYDDIIKNRNNNMTIEIAEYTINQNQDDILKDIYLRKPDVICFSCYIWNLLYVESIVRDIAKVLPEVPLWVGGPEVSYDAQEVLTRLPQLVGVMKGEGEQTFFELCAVYAGLAETKTVQQNEELACGDRAMSQETVQDDFGRIMGITYRDEHREIHENPWRMPMDLSKVPFVYHDMKEFVNKIIYYETSRGCPFSCSYCLSSIDKRLRFRDLSLVLPELQYFLDQKVAQVKFVDRTFNCRHDHAMAIWQYITDHDNGITNFHFEVAADLLNDEEINLIRTMRPGLIQLEIGVQSTNPETIKEIRRTMKLEEVQEHVARIKAGGNIHQHLDLIGGLPYEDLESFKKSFDDVYAMRPDQLQLGFLKVLKGSYMEEMSETYELRYKDVPPYEVLSTKWLSYEDVIELKGIEEMVEVYYNSGQFANSISALEEKYESPYQMYHDIWEHYEQGHHLGVQHKRSARYEILLKFVEKKQFGDADRFRELLTYDYYLRENAKSRPEFAGEDKTDKSFVRRFYEEEEQRRVYLPGYEAYDKTQMRKMTHLEYFPNLKKILLFDYKCRNPLNQEARTCMIENKK